MSSSTQRVRQLQVEIEGALAQRFAGALSLRPKSDGQKRPTGIAEVDAFLAGGFPAGALSELVGPQSSGRTTVAMSLLAKTTGEDAAAAWIDVSDTFDAHSAALCGADLRRLLWVRCADVPGHAQSNVQCSSSSAKNAHVIASKGQLPRGGGSPHPRSEAHGMSDAVASLLQAQPRSAAIQDRRARRIIGTPGAPNRSVAQFPSASPYREEQIPTDRMPARRSVAEAEARAKTPEKDVATSSLKSYCLPASVPNQELHRSHTHSWHALDRALRCADLLLQAGGFSLLVLDLGSIPAEMALRVPLSTWFRFRAACERTRTTMVLMTQHTCAKSSADMVVRMRSGDPGVDRNVLTGIRFVAEVHRQRHQTTSESNVVSIRKPPRSAQDGTWHGRAAWAVKS